MAGYIVGFYFGKIVTGALLGGLIPTIVAFCKRRWGIGALGLVVCGLASLIHSWASVVAGIIFLIIAIVLDSPYPVKKGNKYEDKLFE